MVVNVSAPPVSPDPRGKVTRVRQSGTSLDIDLDDNATIGLTTADLMGCVMVRAATNALEYAD
jgi:two-component sensor histidine kinase